MCQLEVLFSVMNLKDNSEYCELLKRNNIRGNVVAVNQVKDEKDIFNITEGKQKLYTYTERGTSKSRNRLLENASGDIYLFADDDTILEDDYEEIILNEYKKNPKADAIIFYVENTNNDREKNKIIGNKKINFWDAMKVRTYEITVKREILERLNIKYNENFGPGGIFLKGDETVWLSQLLKEKIKIYSVNKKIGISENKKSTWFSGYNQKYLYDQGAIFYKIAPIWYKLLILQYVIRKYKLYKNNLSMLKSYKIMKQGAKRAQKLFQK